MAAIDEFLKDQGYALSKTDNEVRLEKIKKINIISIIIGVIGIGVFISISIMIPPAAALMYVIAAVILLIVLRFNFRGYRPIIIFDETSKMMVRKSVYFFINSQSTPIEGYNGIDVSVVDLATSSSEGVDEFQKTIFIRTGSGEINVVDFYTDHEPVEPEIPELMQVIHEHLSKGKG